MKTAKSTKDKVKAILGYEPQIDMSKHSRIRRIWADMKSRCYNSNCKAYKYYGQKGICVCNEWLQFPNFVAWAFTNGYKDNLSIDRIDSNGNYEPQNCRWVDNYTQANNTSRNHKTPLGTIGELSRKYNINYGTLTNRINRAKMDVSEAISIGKKYHYKPVVQYDIEGNYITEYPSIKDAANAFCRDGHVFGARRYITKCCKHQIASYRGSKFEFKKLPKEIEL